MRARGFGFTSSNKAETVTVKVQLHWARGVSLAELTDVLTNAYAEAVQRATEAT